MIIKKFIVFLILLFLIIFELFSFIYFRFLSNDKNNLAFYTEKRTGALSYRYFENIGLVFPKTEGGKDVIITHYVKEFTDRFIFRDILGLGFGLPDDGIDDRKFKAVAIGDSFTRGVGSQNNLKNGWVELVEKKNKDIDIINLGNLGGGINEYRYKYKKLKNFLNHDIVILSSYSIGDYRENLIDIEYAMYIEKYFKKYGREETTKLINDLQIRHGYKYSLEYLLNNKFKSYSIYFVLKVADYLKHKGLFPAKKFKYKIPEKELRLNVVEDELFELTKLKNYYKYVCNKKYCFETINKNLITEEIFEKIKLNFANKINSFYKEIKKDKKDFIFILHPGAGHFHPQINSYDPNKIDENLLSLLDPEIKVINISKKLSGIINLEKNKTFYYKNDMHYNIEGYKVVSDIINVELTKILK